MHRVKVTKFTAPMDTNGKTPRTGSGSTKDCAYGCSTFGAKAKGGKVPAGRAYGRSKAGK